MRDGEAGGLPLKDLKDLHILNQLSEIYFQNTGMVISFQGPGEEDALLFYPQEQRSDYCSLVQSTPEGRSRCLACDREALAAARRKGGYHVYTCHAGLVDVAIPLDYKGRQIGSMFTGQVLLEEPDLKRALALFGRLGIPQVPFEAFAAAYSRVKVVEHGRLLFYAKLLHLMGNYIILAENEIHLTREVVLKDRELHRRQMERIQLEKTLKDLTISVLEGGRPAGPRTGSARRRRARGLRHLPRPALHPRQPQPRHDAGGRGPRGLPVAQLFQLPVQAGGRLHLPPVPGRRRIEAAQDLLARTDLPIKEVVFRTGFKDYNYFNRTFRRLAGMAPAAYRGRYRRRRGTGGEPGAP